MEAGVMTFVAHCTLWTTPYAPLSIFSAFSFIAFVFEAFLDIFCRVTVACGKS